MINELSSTQRRQLIDTRQIYDAWRSADSERRRRFQGGMRWADRKGTAYLLRKIGKHETSLGPRSPETERQYQAFQRGREENRDRLIGLSKRLDEFAPVNRAMGLGRVPRTAARIARLLDEHGLLGRQIIIVGTNALFAYESTAGVQIASDLIATGDVDLLLDARRRLTLAATDIREAGMLGLLRRVDSSFVGRPGDYKAANRDGYQVDLICPQARDVLRDKTSRSIADVPEDLAGAEIEGLTWFISAPKYEAVAIDDDGFPVRLVTVDPRVFALHKLWLAAREDRDPLKKKRDSEQAKAVAKLATKYLSLSFDDQSVLTVVPAAVRAGVSELLSTPEEGAEADAGQKGKLRPSW